MFHTLFDYQDQNIPNNKQIPKPQSKGFAKKNQKIILHMIIIMEKEIKLMIYIIKKITKAKIVKVVIIKMKNLKKLQIK